MGFSSRTRGHRLWSLAYMCLSPSSSVHTVRCYTVQSSLLFPFLTCRVGRVELLQQVPEFPKGWNCTSRDM